MCISDFSIITVIILPITIITIISRTMLITTITKDDQFNPFTFTAADNLLLCV